MKIHNFVLIFLVICISSFVVTNAKQNALYQVSLQKEKYDSIIERAVDDASQCLVDKDRGNNADIQKEEALDVFFQSVYAGFGILHDEEAKEQLKHYIPVIMVMGRDGCYFLYHEEYEDNGRNRCERWSEKIPFHYYDADNKATIDFTIDDMVYLYDGIYDFSYIGTRNDLNNEVGLDIFNEKEKFDEIRKTTITNVIISRMNYYINQYNLIASNYGIEYEFSIPYFDDSDWARTIDDISIVVMFQGYPYGSFTTERYNCYEISGARVKKSAKYYITEIDGVKYYHTSDCELYKEGLSPYDTKRECALLGAYPCDKCGN